MVGFGLLIALSLWNTLQGIQFQLNKNGTTVTNSFDQSMAILKNDLKATSDAVVRSDHPDEVMRQAMARQLPIFELLLVDPNGNLLAQVHQPSVPTTVNLTEQPWLPIVKAGQIYVGQAQFEPPKIDLAVAIIDRSGQFAGTLLARLNLAVLWHTALSHKKSDVDHLYIMDKSNQLLNYSAMQFIKTGVKYQNSSWSAQLLAMVGFDIQAGVNGQMMASLSQPSDEEGWFVVVEQPLSEVLSPLIWRIIIFLLVFLAVGWLVYDMMRFTQQRVIEPLHILRQAVDRMATGELSQEINIQYHDELGELAESFVTMATEFSGLIDTLEVRIQERIKHLEKGAEISRRLTSILDIDELFQYAINRIQSEFKFYYAHIYLLEKDTGDLVMVEGSGEVGKQLKARGHRLQFGQGIVGTVATTKEIFFSNDVAETPNFFRNPLLPDTQSELAVPLRKGDRVLGVLDVQSEEYGRFGAEDISMMQLIADQIAVAVENARLLTEMQAVLKEVQRLNQRLTRESWQTVTQDQNALPLGYRFVNGSVMPLYDSRATLDELDTESANALTMPLVLRGEVIGKVGLKRNGGLNWAREELAVVEAVANQVTMALENVRLSTEQEKTIVKLQELDRAKSEFLTSMSHELRTPLNAILGFSELLVEGIDGDLPEMALNDAQLIFNSGQHLLTLVNDILDISKIEAGMLEIVPEPADVYEVIEDVVSGSQALIKDKTVELKLDVPEGLPEVYADKIRLKQILINLVGNGVKFTKQGNVTIQVQVSEAEPGKMRFGVIDTGIGIPEDKLEAIFERFKQADMSKTREYGGTGLGLSICKQLTEMHGGRIWVESVVDVGSTFFFTIPLVDSST